jgi:hypothetical protein
MALPMAMAIFNFGFWTGEGRNDQTCNYERRSWSQYSDHGGSKEISPPNIFIPDLDGPLAKQGAAMAKMFKDAGYLDRHPVSSGRMA